MKLTVTYGRCSTSKQENSLETQAGAVAEYMKENGLVTVPELEFADPAVSGRKKPGIYQRPGGRRAVDCLRGGVAATSLSAESRSALAAAGVKPDQDGVFRPKHFVVAKHDRLSRGTRETMEFYDWCLKHGYFIHMANLGTMNVNNTTPMGALMTRFLVDVLSTFSQLEVTMIRERIKDNFVTKRKRGELCGPPAFGQRRVNSGRTHVRDGQTLPVWTWEEDPAEMEVLHTLIRWHYREGLGVWAVATRANAVGYHTKTGGRWNHRSTWGVLHNKFTLEVAAREGLTQCCCKHRAPQAPGL